MSEEMLLDVVLSGEKPFWPDGKRLNVISSGEMRVLPDGVLAAKDTLRTDLSISDEMVPSTKPWMALPSGCIAGSQEGPASLFRNPKNTFEHQTHSTAFY